MDKVYRDTEAARDLAREQYRIARDAGNRILRRQWFQRACRLNWSLYNLNNGDPEYSVPCATGSPEEQR
jgi:hypothetical protein